MKDQSIIAVINHSEALIARIYEHLKDIEQQYHINILTKEDHLKFNTKH